MQLNEIQSRFRDLMLDHPDAVNDPDAALAAVFVSDDIPLPERLRVYRNNIVGTVTDALMATFPILEKLVGKEFLEGMARSFVLQNPPQGGCLNIYGVGFDRFIETFEPAKSLPYLPDVARLELAMNQAYYARDEETLSPEQLQSIPPESLPTLPLALCDCIKLIESKYPLLAIHDFCLNGGAERDETLDLDQGGIKLMVTRPHLEVQLLPLQDSEFKMLKNLQDGKLLGEALELTMGAHEDFDFQEFLTRHLELETFQALDAKI